MNRPIQYCLSVNFGPSEPTNNQSRCHEGKADAGARPFETFDPAWEPRLENCEQPKDHAHNTTYLTERE